MKTGGDEEVVWPWFCCILHPLVWWRWGSILTLLVSATYSFQKQKLHALLTPSQPYRPLALKSLCQIQWYNVSFREFLHSPPCSSFALSLPSIFSLSGLSHTCTWQLRDQELWCCKGYFISGNSHQFLPYCVGYPRTPRVSNAFVWWDQSNLQAFLGTRSNKGTLEI